MRFALPLLLAVSCALLVGCGVRFSDPPPGTEFFKKVTISGDLRAGSTITAHVAIAQHYPVNVPISCELRRSSTALRTLATATVAALADGGPTATPVASTYAFDFKIDAPGTYNVKCVTPSDIDNFIVKQFTVAG
ncbi:MAG TPA: hypothetical protein VEZ14_06185 [Dehalococcoidia bacterium]|nr:hypothetical protein [Dehalococcoidia bacterium]